MNQSIDKATSSTNVEDVDLSTLEKLKVRVKDPFSPGQDWLVVISFLVVIIVFGSASPVIS
jgi:pyruvate/2-oxoglutarate dehydrogenase complex dihydrolipoamide acyltransferase (E2) component